MNSTKVLIGNVLSIDTKLALRILRRLLAGTEKPLALRLWSDMLYGHDTAVDFTLVVRDPSLLRQLVVARSPPLLADAYFRGVPDIEGDLYGVLRLENHFESIQLSWRDKLTLLKDALMLPAPDLGEIKSDADFASRATWRFAHRHSRHSDRVAILFYYDVSNKFYGLRLDEEWMYSCAYFEQPSDSLDTAQRNKPEHVCHKLRL